jgi:predicted trehalose synthase
MGDSSARNDALPLPVDVAPLLDFVRLEKAMYELSYQLTARLSRVNTPARGILDFLDSGP